MSWVAILWPMIASAIVVGFAPAQITSVDQYVAIGELGLALERLSPNTLFREAVVGLEGSRHPQPEALGGRGAPADRASRDAGRSAGARRAAPGWVHRSARR